MRDEKLHAVVARSTFPSQNVQSTSASEHFLGVGLSKKCTPLWREAHFEVKICQNVQNTPAPDYFGKLSCRKSAFCFGAKHVFKSTCTKNTRFGPLLEVAMSKKCTPLWRKAHFEVKMYEARHVRTTFGGSDVLSRGRRKGLCTF